MATRRRLFTDSPPPRSERTPRPRRELTPEPEPAPQPKKRVQSEPDPDSIVITPAEEKLLKQAYYKGGMVVGRDGLLHYLKLKHPKTHPQLDMTLRTCMQWRAARASASVPMHQSLRK